MSPEEANQAAAEGVVIIIEGVDPATAVNQDGEFCVGGLAVLRVGAVSSFLDRTGDLALLDENRAPIGTLCFTRALGQMRPDSLTRWQYAAYLAEVRPEQLGRDYEFSENYLVLDEATVERYKAEYRDGAPIWGGFTHDPPVPRLTAPARAELTALPGILLPTAIHRQSLNRFIEAPNAFDRFLKLYHALELLFDFAVMKQMQSMTDDLAGFGRVISSYSSKELDRLKHIMITFCDDPVGIANNLSLVANHIGRAEEIFQEYGKDGNPLKDDSSWKGVSQAAASSQLTESDVKNLKGVTGTGDYRKFVSYIAAYWIYRVRSSIAHSRVGEFLFLESDEEFIVEFAEPLLREVVRQVLSGATLKRIAS